MQSSKPDAGVAAKSAPRLRHLVVIYLENRSFDHLYGSYPGAEGLSSPSAHIPQVDPMTGTPYLTLPQATDSILPPDLPNAPFDISAYIPEGEKTIDLIHSFYQEQWQINGGKMDSFVSVSDAKGLTLGYYPTASLPLANKIGTMSDQVTLCDHFFHAAFGGSFLNHIWLIAARTPVFPNAPSSIAIAFDAHGKLVTDGAVTPDGFVVNSAFSINTPRPTDVLPWEFVPNQTFDTIGDRMSSAGVEWAWYAGGWNDAVSGRPDPLFQFHHQPFIYFERYRSGTADRVAHLKDEKDFIAAAAAGKLPPLSFVKPLAANDEHPGYADLAAGERHAVELIDDLMRGPSWSETVAIVTYDENGGFWDHVAPPVVDSWGPGTRVPMLVISPFAKGGVDSEVYDTTAILTLIEKWWHLDPLGDRDAAQPDLARNALQAGVELIER